jgi:Tol biopolymer transport system component
LSGAPRQVVNGLLTNVNSQVAFYETSGSAHVAFVQGRYEQPDRRLLWVDRGGDAKPASALHKPFSSPRIAPDGRSVMTWLQDDKVGVWSLDLGRDRLARFSRGIDDHSPVWSPDGRYVAFDSSRSGHYQLFVAPADSTGEERQITHDARNHFVNAWLPDGRLAFTEFSMENGSDVWLMEPRAGADRQPLLHSPFSEGEPAFSADGRWMAFVSDESGRKEVYVQRFPPAGTRLQVSQQGGEEPLWSRTGTELYFRHGRDVLAAQIHDGAELSISNPSVMFAGSFHYNLYPTRTYDVAADQRFLMVEEPPPVTREIRVVRFLESTLNE